MNCLNSLKNIFGCCFGKKKAGIRHDVSSVSTHPPPPSPSCVRELNLKQRRNLELLLQSNRFDLISRWTLNVWRLDQYTDDTIVLPIPAAAKPGPMPADSESLYDELSPVLSCHSCPPDWYLYQPGLERYCPDYDYHYYKV